MSGYKIVFVDTSIFLREFAPDDSELAAECRAFLKMVARGDISAETSVFVCAEIQWVLKRQYKVNKKLRIELLEQVRNLDNLTLVETSDLSSALALYAEHNVKFIDCLIAAYVKKQDIPIVSYDTDFDTLECERLEPEELV